VKENTKSKSWIENSIVSVAEALTVVYLLIIGLGNLFFAILLVVQAYILYKYLIPAFKDSVLGDLFARIGRIGRKKII
jgi:hypothetical protein